MSNNVADDAHTDGFIERIVRAFLYSRLSIVLILLAVLLGAAALLITPREEDPQIVVPMVDIFVNFPGHSPRSVEQLVTTPLESMLYQIDGVNHVYSISRRGSALITVRFVVGQDMERSVVKVYRKINEHLDIVPPGVTGWVIRPETINDVPILTLTLTSKTAGPMMLRQVAAELAPRLAAIKNVSRAYLVGGLPRQVLIYPRLGAMQSAGVSLLQIQQAIMAANVKVVAGSFNRSNHVVRVDVGRAFTHANELKTLVVAVHNNRPVYLSDVATIKDGAAEVTSYVWHSWGPARNVSTNPNFPGRIINQPSAEPPGRNRMVLQPPQGHRQPAVTIAIAKKAGSNAVWVARDVLAEARKLAPTMVPSNIQMIITRNSGLAANDKVNGLVDGLLVAVVIVMALLVIGLGWRESLVVAVAIPVVFGLTLAVNLLLGFTINRVTLFALILSLGLLVDDPIVDVENIARHFALANKASRAIALKAISEILPPLVTATLAVILSFVPMFFITGMMGPYMRPMALNVPVAMIVSLLVAISITPWLSYQLLRHKHRETHDQALQEAADPHAVGDIKKTMRYKLFNPIMAPLLYHRWLRWSFFAVLGAVFAAAVALPALRKVPLKMLPFDNRNNLLLVLHLPRGSTVEQTDKVAQSMGHYLKAQPEVVDFTLYAGIAAPMDFNGLVRQYYLRNDPNNAQITIDLAPKNNRAMQSHALALRMRNALTAIARRYHARLQIVENPPGPPVLDTIVGEVYGSPTMSYANVMAAARTLKDRFAREPGVVDIDDSISHRAVRMVFRTDKTKAALNHITTDDIAQTVKLALAGTQVGLLHRPRAREPVGIVLRLPIAERSSLQQLNQLWVGPPNGPLVQLGELGHWQTSTTSQPIYHKDLHRVVYVYADTAGRAPASVVLDVSADRVRSSTGAPAAAGMIPAGGGFVGTQKPRPLADRSFIHNGSGIPWQVQPGIHINFAGEGEWRITIHVFRDLGIAFGAALAAIYVLLVAQTGSFLLPLIIMLAIPLTIPGVMPGFWLLNVVTRHSVGGYNDPVYFTATAMIGMIALSGIVTRNAVILIDFIHRALARGQTLFDAILESCVVRLRPILLTAGAAMLSSIPILVDPIFSGLAWSLIFGLLASTLFTLIVIPVTYYMLFKNRPGHGLTTIT